MKHFPLLLATLLFLSNCNYSESPVSNADINYRQTDEQIYQAQGQESHESENKKLAIPKERKIIWNANLDFQVTDVDKSTDKISEMVTVKGGFVSGMDVTHQHNEISNNIIIRIGNDQFHSLIKSLKGESIFTKKIEIKSDDVTEDFVDIQSRLKTKKEVRKRYIDILRNKTGDIKDVLAAEDAIRVITEEIEAQEGRLRYLTDKVDFSTITIRIYQEVDYKTEPVVYAKPFSEKMTDGFANGWSAITAIFLALITIWPLTLLLVLFLIWKRKWIRRLISSPK